jgi:hypothetical protein
VTSPVVHETSPAPLPVDRDPFLDDEPQGGAPVSLPPRPATVRRRRVLD